MKKRINNTRGLIKQRGIIILALGIFVLAGILLINLALAAGISIVGYSATAGYGGDLISPPSGEVSVETVTGKGSYINNDSDNHFIPCFKQDSGMWCGRASAAMVIEGYTGKKVNQATIKNWGGALASRVSGKWIRRSNYTTDQMNKIIETIRGGDAAIIYTQNPNRAGSGSRGYGHIMVVTQYDQSKDSFLVHNSNTKGCQLQWVSRSFLMKNSHRDGYAWRIP